VNGRSMFYVRTHMHTYIRGGFHDNKPLQCH